MTHRITSLQNPQIKEAIKLQNRKDRDRSGLFLIEGFRELARALAGGVSIPKLFTCPELFLGENETDLIDRVASLGGAIIQCDKPLFEKLSYRDRPDGLVAIGAQMALSLGSLGAFLPPDPILVVAEAIEKPGNLGTIMRSADGVGASGVIVCDRCTDIYNPNVVRSSVGTLFTQPVIEAGGSEAFIWLQEHGIKIVATSPAAPTVYTEANLRGPIAIVVGTEQLGLSERWLLAADVTVSIPMLGVADSLNVATATTLLLYEVLRQRKLDFPIGADLY